MSSELSHAVGRGAVKVAHEDLRLVQLARLIRRHQELAELLQVLLPAAQRRVHHHHLLPHQFEGVACQGRGHHGVDEDARRDALEAKRKLD